MKNHILLFCLLMLIILSSCENKEKYYGEWMMTPPYNPTNQAEKIIITKDSIFIAYYPYYKFHSESLKLNGNKLELLNNSFDLKIDRDSLLNFNNSTYIRKGYPYYDYFESKKLISIEYPKIENIKNIDRKGYPQIYFGKKINSNEYILQLNDRIAEMRDVKRFLFPSHNSYHGVSLTADKNAKMKDINEIFYYSKSINVRKIRLVNDINYYYEENNMILTSEEGIHIYLNDLEEEILIQKDSEPLLIPRPPTPTYYSLKKVINESKQIVISLVNNKSFFGLKKVNKTELFTLILNNFQDKYFIIIYDDESKYGNYLELINIHNNAFSENRNIKSIKKFNSLFNSLSREEKNEIVMSTSNYMLTGISFNDFKQLNIKIPELKLLD